MTSYSQRDPLWSHIKMGQSSLTIGRFGCTTTAIAMLSTYFLPSLTPSQVAANIKYTKDGLIIWQSCTFQNFVFERRAYSREDAVIKMHLLDPNLAVILEVANKSHWVVAVGTTLFGQYRIVDPWDGQKKTMAAYGNNISGAAYFKKK